MNENLKKLMEEISKNPDLTKRITKAGNGEVLAIAKELNIELAEEDLKVPEQKELSENELEAVTGGGGCGCVLYGVGGRDGLKCECMHYGGGVSDETSHCVGYGHGACACVGGGAGATNGRECNQGTNSEVHLFNESH